MVDIINVAPWLTDLALAIFLSCLILSYPILSLPFLSLPKARWKEETLRRRPGRQMRARRARSFVHSCMHAHAEEDG